MRRLESAPQQGGGGVIASVDRGSLGSNFAWSLVGNLAYSVSAWLTLLCITTLGSPDMLGEYALAAAVLVPVFTLSQLQLSTLQATDVARRHAFGDYLALRIWATLLACAVAAGLAWHSWPEGRRALVIAAVAAGLAALNLSGVCYGAFRRRERVDLMARSILLRATAGVFMLAVVLRATGDLVAALAVRAAIGWMVAALVDLPSVHVLLADERLPDGLAATRLRWNTATSLGIAVTALPVGLVMMLGDLQVTIPRLVIESVLGTHALGIFVAVAAVASVGGTVARSGSQAVVPRLAALHGEGDAEGMRGLLRRLVGVGLVAGGVGVGMAALAGGPMLRMVYGDEHAGYGGLLVIFAAAATVTWLLGLHTGALTAMRRFKEQAVLRSAQLLLLMAVCTPLTTRYGLVGTAWALLLAESVGLVLQRWAVGRYLGVDR